MVLKNIKFILIILLFYQNTLFTESNSFEKIDSKNLSKYFSGIVAFGNKKNSEALDFFNSSKILINAHDPFLLIEVSLFLAELTLNLLIGLSLKIKSVSIVFMNSWAYLAF